MKRNFIVTLFLTMGLSQTNLDKVGTVGALFLNIPAGAASQGMGKAYSGMVQGASATFWNPALLGFEKSFQTFTGYTVWLLGLHHQTAAVTFRKGRYGVGLSQILLTTEPLPVTTTREPNGTGESFWYADLALGVSLSRAFSDRFSLGVTLRYVRESVYQKSAQGFSVDVGSFYWIGYRDLRIYMVLKNFGPDLRFGGSFYDTRVKGNVMEEIKLNYGEFALPLTFVMGLASTVWEGKNQSLLLALEASHPADYSQRLHLGTEFTQGKYLKLRGGYKLNYEQESWSLGCGVNIGKIHLDMAYTAMKKFSGITAYSIHYIIK